MLKAFWWRPGTTDLIHRQISSGNPWRKLQRFNVGYSNLGDELNEDILMSLTDESRIVRFNERRANFYGIGSILEIAARSKQKQKLIWGSGLRSPAGVNFLGNNCHVLALRGKLTADILGYKDEATFGDPGLLASFFDKSTWKTSPEGITFAPHFSFFGIKGSLEAINQVKKMGMRILYPNVKPATAIEIIKGSELLVSSALHPLILADSFGIPTCRISKFAPSESEFKYQDYLSVASPNMPWYELNDLSELKSESKAVQTIEMNYTRLEVLRTSVPKIQSDLIESFNVAKSFYQNLQN
jgi:hypothetical protein